MAITTSNEVEEVTIVEVESTILTTVPNQADTSIVEDTHPTKQGDSWAVGHQQEAIFQHHLLNNNIIFTRSVRQDAVVNIRVLGLHNLPPFNPIILTW